MAIVLDASKATVQHTFKADRDADTVPRIRPMLVCI